MLAGTRNPEQEGAVRGEFVTMKEAQEILGVSNFTIWQMVKDGRLPTFRSEVDRRKKLIRRSDLDAIQAPKPINLEDRDEGQAKKSAA
jgi:excisionase family DNA binding protein